MLLEELNIITDRGVQLLRRWKFHTGAAGTRPASGTVAMACFLVADRPALNGFFLISHMFTH